MRRLVRNAVLSAGVLALTVPLASAYAESPAKPGGFVPPGLEKFYAQKLEWAPCKKGESTLGRAGASSRAAVRAGGDDWATRWQKIQCTTVRVPLDHRRPDGPEETVALSRRAATGPGNRLGVLLPVPGGPGEEGFYNALAERYDKLAERYDIIGYDPRGVGRSSRLECADHVWIDHPTRPTAAEMRAVVEQVRKNEDGCRRAGGERRRFFTTANSARDLDIVRAALGETKLNLLGQSYGTYVTAVYGSLFPGGLNRNVLDSAVHPRWPWREAWRRQAMAQRKAADAWMAWAARHDDRYRLGRTAEAVHDSVERLRAELAAPEAAGEGHRPSGSEFDSIIGYANDPADWDYVADVVVSLRGTSTPAQRADAGRAVAVLSAAGDPNGRGAGAGDEGEGETANGVWSAVNCEVPWPKDPEVYYADMRLFAEKYPYGWGARSAAPLECAFTDMKPLEPTVPLRRAGYPQGIVVQGEFDPATPYEGGPAMAGLLHQRLVTGRGEGRHVAYGENACYTAIVDEYLLDGKLPAEGAACAGPDPDAPPPPDESDSLQEQARDMVRERS